MHLSAEWNDKQKFYLRLMFAFILGGFVLGAIIRFAVISVCITCVEQTDEGYTVTPTIRLFERCTLEEKHNKRMIELIERDQLFVTNNEVSFYNANCKNKKNQT